MTDAELGAASQDVICTWTIGARKGDTGAAGASGITWQFPIGYVLIDTSNTNPASFLGYGTWQQFADGRVLVGIDSLQTEFDAMGETGGAKTHTLTTAQIPSHIHGGAGVNYLSNGYNHDGEIDGSRTVNPGDKDVLSSANYPTGGGGAHNNLQPYIVVRFWKRTA